MEFPIYICQIFVLKIINLGVIFFELNRQTQALAVQRLVRDNEDHDGGYYKDSDSVREEAEKLLCWETYIGIYVWKLVFSSMICLACNLEEPRRPPASLASLAQQARLAMQTCRRPLVAKVCRGPC